MSLAPEKRKFRKHRGSIEFRLYICPQINGGPSNSFREETSAVRPRKLPYKPVIGELENRTEYGS